METPDKECGSSQYRIFVQDIEQHLAPGRVHRVEAEEEVEQMFSLLNTESDRGNNPARMCKILNSLSPFLHEVLRQFSRPFYLIEGERLKSGRFAGVGHGIALLVRQPVLLRIRSGKD